MAYSTPSQPGTTRRIAEHLDRVWARNRARVGVRARISAEAGTRVRARVRARARAG